MMNKNIRIAKELIKLAKNLVANTLPNEEIEKIKQYLNDFASKNGYTVKEDGSFDYRLLGKAKAFYTDNKQCDLEVTIEFNFDKNKYSVYMYSKKCGGINGLMACDDEIKNFENIKKHLESNIGYVLECWESNQLFGKY